MELKFFFLALLSLMYLETVHSESLEILSCDDFVQCHNCIIFDSLLTTECPKNDASLNISLKINNKGLYKWRVNCNGLNFDNPPSQRWSSYRFEEIYIINCTLDDIDPFENISDPFKPSRITLENVRIDNILWLLLLELTKQLETLIFSNVNLHHQISELTNLTTLKYERCSLDEIDKNALSTMKLVVTLSFARNFLLRIEDKTFEVLHQLQDLYLNDNLISHIGSDAFAGLQNLMILDVSNNRLKSIRGDLCIDCISLISLNMSWNSLEEIDSNAFSVKHLDDVPLLLKHVDLSHNRLNYTQAKLFLGKKTAKFDVAGTLEEVSDLKTLDLSYNRIGNISDEWTVRINLEKLNLQHNAIHIFNLTGIKLVNTSIVIDLRNNDLATASFTYVRRLLTSQLLKIKLLIGDKIDCGCSLIRLIYFMTQLRGTTVFEVDDEDSCSSPAGFEGRKLKSLTVAELPCDCPMYCQCSLEPLGNLKMVCENIDMTRKVSKEFDGRMIEYHQKYAKGKNSFSNLTLDRFQDVIHLNLSSNKIKDLDTINLPECIQSLDLRNNIISEVSTKFVMMLMERPLKKLYMYKNRIECDCSNWPFILYFQMRGFQEPLHLKCDGGKTLLELTQEDLCEDYLIDHETVNIIRNHTEQKYKARLKSCNLETEKIDDLETEQIHKLMYAVPVLLLISIAVLIFICKKFCTSRKQYE